MKINKMTITKDIGRFVMNNESVDDVLENLQRIKEEGQVLGFLNLDIRGLESWGERDYVVIGSRLETDEEFKKRSKKLTRQSNKAKTLDRDLKYAEFLKLKAEFEPEK